jgi:mycofactocin system glycosyltransferase
VDSPPVDTLAYRLRDPVKALIDADAVHLILAYPLKTITLHRGWQGVFRQLAAGRPAAIAELSGAMGAVSRERLVAFLNQLVFKGFLERSGRLAPWRFPQVSVIVPVRNRPGDIAACLDSLTRLDYPAEKLEVIVVDDASEDETPAAAAVFGVRVIRLKRHRRASFCRNVGARQARGEILAFIDSDCLADPLWLKQLIPAFEDASLAAIGGRVDAYCHDTTLDRYEKVKSSLMVSRYAKRSTAADPFFYVPACNFLIRRDVFRALEGFDIRMNVGEDVDLCWRLQNQGQALEFRTDGVVYHKHRNRLAAFCRRRFDYGTSEPMLQKMHPERIKTLYLPPPAVLFWSLLLLWPLTRLWLAALGAGLTWIVDALCKKRRLRRLPVSLMSVMAAVARQYGALAYHLCAFASRYYLIWAIPLSALDARLGAGVLSMHLINGLGEYALNRGGLRLPAFIWFFTLEQLSYQVGVWWGCLQLRRFSSVNPVIVCKGGGS